MPTFPEFIRQQLERSGYKTIQQTAGDVFMRTPSGEAVWICYLDAAIPPEDIRRAFEFSGHVLFVVDDKLIPQDIKDRQSTPMWLRVLHGLYMGRIYTWNGRFLYGLHFDYEKGVINESGAIMPDELLLTEEKTWLKGWTDIYRIARFYDRAWWTDGGFYQKANEDFRQRYENAQKQQYEQAKHEQKQRRKEWEDDFNKRWYYGGTGQQKQEYNTSGGGPFDSKQENPGRDFAREFRACNSLMEIKALYRNLAREYHPDLNPDKDTTVIMQQINAAYDRAKMVYA